MYNKEIWDSFFEGVLEGVDEMLSNQLTEARLGKTIDWAEQDDHNYYLTINAAGFSKEDIEIETTGRVITVKGKSSHERVKNSLDYYFTAPKAINGGKIKADLENGLLVVTIPKDQPESIKIKVN
jgi:HSP20 family molecular chaperone IbpA